MTVDSLNDVYVYDVATGTNTLVSINTVLGTGSGNSDSYEAVISADGSKIAYRSHASDLTTDDTDSGADIFLYDIASATNTLVSVSRFGGSGNGSSFDPVISADGSQIAFESVASNLTANDLDGLPDIFLYDTSSATNTLVSVNRFGGSSNSNSLDPVISADGSKVAFRSYATNLTVNDTDFISDVFLYDVASATNTLVSVGSGGGSGNNTSLQPAISADGSKVVFRSRASNLTANDTDTFDDVFLFDVSTETNTLVSVGMSGLSGNGFSAEPVINADGSQVAYYSFASNLSALDTNSHGDVFLFDVAGATNTLLSLNTAGTASGDGFSGQPVISAAGAAIGFNSYATELHVGDLNHDRDVFVWEAGTIELISVVDPSLVSETGAGDSYTYGQTVSDDGRYVVFESRAGNLAPGDSNGRYDVFLRDRQTGTTRLISQNLAGIGSGNSDSYSPVISGDGSKIAYYSYASHLTASDANGRADVYLYDVATGSNTLVSVNSTGTNSGNLDSLTPAISSDGSKVAYISRASDLAANDTNGRSDVYLYDVATGTNTLVSLNSAGTASGNGDSRNMPSISADGSRVVYSSSASDLTTTSDANGGDDVFLYDVATATNRLVSIDYTGTASGSGPSRRGSQAVISAGGTKVAFTSWATDLVTNDSNGRQDVFLYDVASGANTLVSIDHTGVASGIGGDSSQPVISADGSRIAYISRAHNLVTNDTNNRFDVFLYDADTSTNTLVSVNSAGTSSGNGDSRNPVISGDGAKVAYDSSASDLVSVDGNLNADSFLYDAADETNILLSINSAGSDSGNGRSAGDVVISADGTTVAFDSSSSDLVANDYNGTWDVFAYSTNSPPTIEVDASGVNFDEGETASNAGTYSDPGDTVSLSASVGTVVDNANGTWSWSWDTSDGPEDSQTVTITATDSSGAPASVSFSLIVDNVAPTLGDASFDVVENSADGTPVGTVTGSDPGEDTLTYGITGGTGETAFAIDASTGAITVAESAQLDFEASPVLTLEVTVTDDEGETGTSTVTINLLNQASITGTVFVDTNENGFYEADEMGIDGVTIELLDGTGAVVETAVTSDGGYYQFEDYDPGTYQIREVQPTGVTDGAESLGNLGGTIVSNDVMEVTLARADAEDYDFAEIGQSVSSGDAATIGFWQNKHGQALIEAGGSALATWLGENFANVFGNEFDGASGADVAEFYKQQLFKQKAKKSAGPAKVDAQFMAVALATFFTSNNLAGTVAADYGFNVTDTGIGTKIVNVGSNGAAFDVAAAADLTIMQLLLATNALTDLPDAQSGFASIYDQNGDRVIDSAEAALRSSANEVFSRINEQGDV